MMRWDNRGHLDFDFKAYRASVATISDEQLELLRQEFGKRTPKAAAVSLIGTLIDLWNEKPADMAAHDWSRRIMHEAGVILDAYKEGHIRITGDTVEIESRGARHG